MFFPPFRRVLRSGLAALAATACLLPASAFANDTAAPLRIGVTGPFTGPSSPMGISMREGIRIAAAEVNARGGVLGRPLELVERDDEARNELGASIAQQLIEHDGIVAGLGVVNTGVALASQRYYQEARIPIITSVATGSLITRQFVPPEHPDNFVFRVSASDTIQAAMIVVEAVDRRRLHRLAIFHDATNYGLMGRDDLERALALRNVAPVAIERFHLRQADMTTQLLRARGLGAQAILTYGIGPELAQIANGMARIDWQVPIIGSWTLAMSNFIDNAGPNGEGTRMPQTFIADATTPRRRAFLQAWHEQTGNVRIPVPPAAAQGYDSLVLLVAAIAQANSTDGDQIRAALENLREKVEGIVMTYDRPFTKENHETISNAHQIFMGEVKNGRVVFSHEEDRRRASGQ